jgi:hypothetical protein
LKVSGFVTCFSWAQARAAHDDAMARAGKDHESRHSKAAADAAAAISAANARDIVADRGFCCRLFPWSSYLSCFFFPFFLFQQYVTKLMSFVQLRIAQ